MRRSKLIAVLCAFLGAAVVAACGTQATGRVANASLVLDFTPNAIHSGIYTALARGYDRRSGVRLHVIVPGASTDGVKLLVSGRADFAILDIHDLAIARAHGEPLEAVMAIVQRPLASVIAAQRFPSPKALQGQTVGVTGAPSDLAVLRSEVIGAGGNPARIHTITIGFNAVPALLAGRVTAATAFWNDEGVTLQHARRGFHVFRVEDYGAPPYPELVVCATTRELRHHPGLARGLVHALVRGYQAVLQDPAAGAEALESHVTGLSPRLVAEQLRAELPAFEPVGVLQLQTLRRWASWEARFGIVRRVPDVARMFDRAFLPASATGRAGA